MNGIVVRLDEKTGNVQDIFAYPPYIFYSALVGKNQFALFLSFSTGSKRMIFIPIQGIYSFRAPDFRHIVHF
jgi:hypothetical protein